MILSVKRLWEGGGGRGAISSVNETNKRERGNMKLVWKAVRRMVY